MSLITHFEGLAEIYQTKVDTVEELQAILEDELSKFLTKDMLEVLVVAAKIMGEDYDEGEVFRFVEDLFVIAGEEEDLPDLRTLLMFEDTE